MWPMGLITMGMHTSKWHTVIMLSIWRLEHKEWIHPISICCVLNVDKSCTTGIRPSRNNQLSTNSSATLRFPQYSIILVQRPSAVISIGHTVTTSAIQLTCVASSYFCLNRFDSSTNSVHSFVGYLAYFRSPLSYSSDSAYDSPFWIVGWVALRVSQVFSFSPFACSDFYRGAMFIRFQVRSLESKVITPPARLAQGCSAYSSSKNNNGGGGGGDNKNSNKTRYPRRAPPRNCVFLKVSPTACSCFKQW